MNATRRAGAPVSFTFDGERYQGVAGDTLASALIANGVHLVGRSFKYHRPRGILAAGAEEPNALVTIDRGGGRETPNLRATTVEIYEGLQACSQNRWPSLKFDAGAINSLFSPLFPAGFYYKTFMWPRAFWAKIYEPAIRRAAGLGKAPRAPDPDRYLQRYRVCDVIVVGAGPAGIAAARAASAVGKTVLICDEQAAFGGSLLHSTETIEGKHAGAWVADALAELARLPNVTMLPRTTAFGYYAQNFLGLVERVTDHLDDPDPKLPRERLWQVRAREVVLATGAIEKPIVFPGNDRPGVMLADAARTYLNRYRAKPGTRAVVVTCADSAYAAAFDLHDAGVSVLAIADQRADVAAALAEGCAARGISLRTNSTVHGTSGRLHVNSVSIGPVNSVGVSAFSCDLLLMCGGWTPSVHLYSQSRGKVVYDEALQTFVPGASVQRERSAGGCRGTFDTAAAIAEGREAGTAAAQDARAARRPLAAALPAASGAQVAAQPTPGKYAFIDFQNDVMAKDVKLAVREGFRSIEHIKRYTTSGMATDQGKTSNMNALAIAADSLHATLPAVGLTTFRTPYTPVTFGAIAGTARGDLFDPVRKTPIHRWAEEQGAVFEDVGLWKRARYFPRVGEDMHAAVNRECVAVRNGVGIFDASTLGKIEIVGPDAAEFMNRLYINAWAKLEVGKCRYGLMLSEAGFVMDDGVVGRMAQDRFHVTTTTGGAPRVLHHMEDYIQTEFPDLRVWLTSTTEQWAVIAVQGPRARETIAPLIEGIDLSPTAMPHMSVREGTIAGVPTRLFRVSFTGDAGFEINVPARHGRAVWEAVYQSGQRFGITPYGTETMHVLRAEKGYIIVGQESDGTVIPEDLGLSGMIGKAKPDFVGKRSLARPDMLLPDRKQLVGLLTDDPKTVLEEGAQIVADPNAPIPMPMLGQVTSSYWSANLGRSIALALVSGGRARKGTQLFVPMPDRVITVNVVEPVFLDPGGERLNG